MFKRQRTPEENPTRRPSPYVPSEKIHTGVGLAFRISNIPNHITIYQFFQLLDSLPRDLSRNDGQSNVLGWSFAPAAASADAGLYSTATVTFKTAPTLFQFPWPSRFFSLIEHQQPAVVDKHFYGLTPLSGFGEQATVDIVAVTGLAGHAFGSWKARHGSAMWLRDFLPEHVPTARIMTYGYDSRLLLNTDSTASIREFSQNFLEALSTVRVGDTRRPIIFIGHSLGGLVIKQALTEASRSGDQRRAIFDSCYGLLLFGVPNKGLDVERLRDMVKGQPNSQLIEDLDSSSDFLRRQNFFWEYIGARDTRIISVYETKLTATVQKTSGVWAQTGPKVMMVSRESAIWATPKGNEDDTFSIDADHSAIAKFTDSASPDYLNVRSRIITLVQEAPSAISKRFEQVESQQQGGSVPRAVSNMESMYIQFRGDAEERKQRKILKWLSRIEYMQHNQIALEGILEGTGEWLLKKEEFRRWRSSNVSSILWLHGIPGAGKTKLTCMIIETIGSPLQQSKTHQTCEPVVFFYCNRDDSQRRDPTPILQSLVKQMSRALPGLPKAVVAVYDKTEEPLPLGFQGSHDMLVSLLENFPRTTIVIDALDESDPIERCRLLEVLNNIVQSSAGVVKIFVSSRDDVDIQLRLDKVPNLYIEAQDNEEDIKRFINREMADPIKNGRLARLPDEMKDKIVSTLVSKAGGMFQWVNLQIPYLNAMRFDDDIIDSLGKLPRTLKATYSQILAAMHEGTVREWAVTVRALMWMISSQIPLTQQLWAELTYWPNTVPTHGVTTLFELCRHLVTSNSQSKYVSFAHLSVREYLETEFTPEDSNFMAGQCCLSILDPAIAAVMPYRPSEWAPLTCYAFRYWPVHLNRSYLATKHMPKPLLDDLKRFLGSSAVPGQPYCRWISMLSDSPYGHYNNSGHHLENPKINSLRYPSGDRKLNTFDCEVQEWRRDLSCHLASTPPNPLFVACYYRFGEELHDMFACNNLDIRSTNNEGQTLLHVASFSENDWAVDTLLNAGADPNFLVVNDPGMPLDYAFLGGSKGVVAQLLNRGAHHCWSTNILVAAARRASMSLMTWLIDQHPGIKITESVITTMMEEWDSDEDVLRMLLARVPHIEINEAVAGAVVSWKQGLILLLDKTPQINITEAGLTVLIRSADTDWISKLLAKLLARDPPIKITEAVLAALVAASFYIKPEMLKMVLATTPHIKLTAAVLAAAAASEYPREHVIRALLAWDPNFKLTLPTIMKFPPHLSIGIVFSLLARVPTIVITERLLLDNMHDNQSCDNVMGVLLKNYPNVHITEPLLLAAAMHQRASMMEILLACARNITITETVVSAAVLNHWCGNRLISILLNKDPKIKITVALLTAAAINTRCGMSILQTLLATAADIKMIREFLTWETNVEITDTVLAEAMGNLDCSPGVMELLLAQDSDIKLTKAVVEGFNRDRGFNVLTLTALLDRVSGFDITTEAVIMAARCLDIFQDTWWRPSLNDLKGRLIKLLLARDQNIEIREGPLLTTSAYWNDEMMAMLLDRDPSININDEDLLAGAQNGGGEVLGMLLVEGQNMAITEQVLLSVAEYQNLSTMEMLLARDPSISITEEHLLAVARNESWGVPVMEFLLTRDPNIPITEKLVLMAVEHRCSRMVEILLATDQKVTITDNLLVKAMHHHGPPMLDIFLSSDRNIPITEEILLDAVENSNAKTVKFLLARNQDIQITEAFLLAAIEHEQLEELMEMLVPRAGGIEITEKVLVAVISAIEYYADHDVGFVALHSLLLAREPGTGITEAVVATAIGQAGISLLLMDILLSHDPNIRTTEAVMVAAAGNEYNGTEMMKVLISRNPDITIGAEVMIVATKNYGCGKGVIMVLLTRDLDVEIEGERGVLLEMLVARTFGSELVTIVIPRNPNTPASMMLVKQDFRGKATSIELSRGSDIKITETVMAAAANNWDYSTQAIKLLLTRDPNIEVTEVALKNAGTDPECDMELLALLLARGPTIKSTEALTTIDANNRDWGVEVIDRATSMERSEASLGLLDTVILRTK